MDYRIHKKENLYFGLRVFFTLVVAAGLGLGGSALLGSGLGTMAATIVTFAIYALAIALFFWFQKVILIGHLKGNGVCVSERQFPEVYAEYKRMGEELGLKRLPGLFLLQEGGLLNAFAIRFSGRNYVAIYSEVLSLVSSDPDSVRFVLAHELGHVKRAHMSRRFWTGLSAVVPFLGAAYSRSCEYTCDNIGSRFAGSEPLQGLVLLAAGKELYKRIDVEAYVEDARRNYSGAVRFAGLFMSHPYLPARLRNLRSLRA